MDRIKERLLSPGEAARMFGVNPKTITRWADKGMIRSTRTLGGHRRFYYTDILRLMSAKTTHAKKVEDG